MAKPLQPGYIYIDSELLKQRVAYHVKSGWLFCEDKGPDGKLVSYSPSELKVFEDAGEPISMAVHNVKKIIGGEVVKNETDKKKTDSIPSDTKNISQIVPDGSALRGRENTPVVREGELDIY